MYTPSAFAVTDLPRLHEFLQQHSFATLVSESDDGLAISHLPLLLDADRGPQGTLIGHFARANDHWKRSTGGRSVAIFNGPHAYVSPAWYEEPHVVPTWNYIAVHATGPLQIVDDRDWLRELVRRTVNLYEAARPVPWRMESQDPAFIDKLLAAIVGFELPIERLEGKWKLSQNHSPARRERVMRQLRAMPGENEQAIAQWMASLISK
jgi:transcriptional regulator